MTQNKVDVIVCTHKDFPFLESDALHPIQNGKTIASVKLPFRGDDTGDNISQYKEFYGEGSSIYWLWKNSDADIKGVMQYRRYLNLTNSADVKINVKKVIGHEKEIATQYGLTSENIQKRLKDNDLIILRSDNINDFFYGNIEEQFKASHPSWVWDKMLELLKQSNLDFYEFVLKEQKKQLVYFKNMFIAKRELFDQICSDVLSVCEKLRTSIDMSRPEFNDNFRFSSRIIGFVLERLVGLYALYLKDKGLKLYEAASLEILEGSNFSTEVEIPVDNRHPIIDDSIDPVASKNVIVFSPNDKYAGPLAATIESVIDNYSGKSDFEIVILYNDLTENNEKLIIDTIANRIQVRFYSVKDYCNKFKSYFFESQHITIETYIRIFIPLLFAKYHRALWLDADMIIQQDVSILLQQDMGSNWFAAVQDPYVVACSFGDRNGQETQWMRNHLKNDLGFDNYTDYFNSGILMFNIPQCNRDDVFFQLLKQIKSGINLVYHDQDIVNSLCRGKHVHWLSPYWNVAWNASIDWARFSYMNSYQQTKYILSRAFIIHYCGWCKPWDHPEQEYAEVFWKYCRKTPFYERMLLQNKQNVVVNRNIDVDNFTRQLIKHKVNKYKILKKLSFGLIGKWKHRYNYYKDLYCRL